MLYLKIILILIREVNSTRGWLIEKKFVGRDLRCYFSHAKNPLANANPMEEIHKGISVAFQRFKMTFFSFGSLKSISTKIFFKILIDVIFN